MRNTTSCASLLLASLALVAGCQSAQQAGGGTSAAAAAVQEPCGPGCYRIFNGKDLTGWTSVNCFADTFVAKDGMLFCNGNPTGFLRTDRMYENYVLEFDWKHEAKEGNAGLFV
jgi:hypothetical protein